MKLLPTFDAITNISASSSNANFPVANVLNLDPFIRWQADSYTADQWAKGQISKAITGLFLNQCNFPQAVFQWNATDVWTDPSVEISLPLVLDRINNRKGFFPITGTGAGFFRILVAAGQTLDNSEAVPAIGNILVGTSVEMPNVSRFSPDVEGEVIITKAYQGSPVSTPIGRQYHVITVEIDDWWSRIRAMPIAWTHAVLFADKDYVDEAWLVFRPARWPQPFRSRTKAGMTLQLGEWN